MTTSMLIASFASFLIPLAVLSGMTGYHFDLRRGHRRGLQVGRTGGRRAGDPVAA
jgi:hypothetical protein